MGFYTSEPMNTAPEQYRTDLQKLTYNILQRLGIEFSRIDCDPAITMEDCANIDRALDMHTVKTLLLCNRQQTHYYLLVMPGDKPFVTRDFGAAMGCSRVSFAPAQTLLDRLHCEVGASTVFGLLLPYTDDIELAIDTDIFQNKDYGGTDGTTTCYMRLSMEDFRRRLLPAIRSNWHEIKL